MATRTITLNILINGTGTEIPNLLTTDPYELYLIQGTAIAIGNYAIVPTGTPSLGLTYKFKYKASLDITTNSKTFSLFGTSITQEQLNKNWSAECYYNGTSWDIILDMDFSEAGIISSNNLQANIINSTALANGSVTTPKLANLAVTDAKLASDAVTTSKILDANVTTAKIADDAITTVKVLDANITTPKINDLAVTTNKINTGAVTNAKVASNAIDTANIITNAVTNSKLALGTPSSVKIVDAAGNVQDLALAVDELPIGNGTTVVPISVNSISQGIGQRCFETVNISFESGEQALNRVYLPKCYIEQIIFQVTKDLSGTDDGVVATYVNASATTPPDITYPAGSTIPSTNSLIYSVHPTITSPTGGWIELRTSKTTPGGKLIASIVYIRQ